MVGGLVPLGARKSFGRLVLCYWCDFANHKSVPKSWSLLWLAGQKSGHVIINAERESSRNVILAKKVTKMATFEKKVTEICWIKTLDFPRFFRRFWSLLWLAGHFPTFFFYLV